MHCTWYSPVKELVPLDYKMKVWRRLGVREGERDLTKYIDSSPSFRSEGEFGEWVFGHRLAAVILQDKTLVTLCYTFLSARPLIPPSPPILHFPSLRYPAANPLLTYPLTKQFHLCQRLLHMQQKTSVYKKTIIQSWTPPSSWYGNEAPFYIHLSFALLGIKFPRALSLSLCRLVSMIFLSFSIIWLLSSNIL